VVRIPLLLSAAHPLASRTSLALIHYIPRILVLPPQEILPSFFCPEITAAPCVTILAALPSAASPRPLIWSFFNFFARAVFPRDHERGCSSPPGFLPFLQPLRILKSLPVIWMDDRPLMSSPRIQLEHSFPAIPHFFFFSKQAPLPRV